ncbi:oxaloacetate decarboxylase [Streptomyces sp. NPDC101181]|uniref:isocitrate lyase/PEP mutase family protein n=1 Tax=Streptomyces sp. NPDC101181 TaxID=3366125 RepID=UPI003811E40F
MTCGLVVALAEAVPVTATSASGSRTPEVLTEESPTSKRSTTRLRRLIDGDGIHVAPGAYDGLSARLVEESGSELLYASGGAIARSCGIPDIGLLGLTEVAARIEQMDDVTSLPVIADADTGFGNAVNAVRTLALYERIGVAGLHIEDQTFPKRCGHLDDKSLVPTDEMARKVRALAEARTDPDFVLIARTDAIATEGLNSSIEPAHAYAEAGADVIFVEAPEMRQTLTRRGEAACRRRLDAPLLVATTGGLTSR